MDVFALLQMAYALALCVTLFAAIRWGGLPERAGAALVAFCSVLTIPAVALAGPGDPGALTVLLVDLLLLGGLLYFALRSDRFWPLWATGFQLVAVATHVAMLHYPTIVPTAYKLVRGAWAYPIMAVILLGISVPARSWRVNRPV